MFIPQVQAARPIDVINSGQPAGLKIPTGANIGQILTGGGINLISLAFFFVGASFMFILIGAGWDYMTSSGDPKKIASATSKFNNAFIGLLIAFFSFIIVNTITNMIGLGSLL